MKSISEQDLWRFIDGDLGDEELDYIAMAIAEDEATRTLYESLLSMHMQFERFFQRERKESPQEFRPDRIHGRGQN